MVWTQLVKLRPSRQYHTAMLKKTVAKLGYIVILAVAVLRKLRLLSL